ncbi:hypothetical protein COT65_01920 [Candidatus Shapirobacteria bacterium CG09_land_8_20_14_0_10_47_13]|uniref:DUF5667 domain-containing protein n=1 Tax=Candidatus Shapirobacteria bacterium CG09_land_8_20_14_0_10_47_13 TaxID=1974481 RepID=A0A2H0WMH9_9BACT|nr:MAG: hypothetical protein COT65_01920 [Candidatus Shapirobacteria bacterium CG09_land_8_20_14_0_10_47_13]
MRRGGFILAFILLFSSCALVHGQNFDFKTAQDNYLAAYNQYRTAHEDYVTASQAYLNYQTLTSKTEAFSKTLKMLEFRDEVIKTYLTTIRLKLAETTNIANYEQNVLYLKLDSEIAWYAKHRDSLASAGDLEDLISSSDEAQRKYQETEIFIYQVLGSILGGKETSLRDKINQNIEVIKTKLAAIKQTGDKNTTTAERWLLEAGNRLTRSSQKQVAAQKALSQMRTYDSDKAETYGQAQATLGEAHQYLKEANSNLRELIAEVKNAD